MLKKQVIITHYKKNAKNFAFHKKTTPIYIGVVFLQDKKGYHFHENIIHCISMSYDIKNIFAEKKSLVNFAPIKKVAFQKVFHKIKIKF
jgi:hypothetical protein